MRQRRDLRGSGGVVPKLRVAAETGLESNLFSQVPRRFATAHCVDVAERPSEGRVGRLESMWAFIALEGVAEKSKSSAGGEDKGYFACHAGGRRFESCHGNRARVAQW